MSIIAEKNKETENGNIHEYEYHHCTRKSKMIKCAEPQLLEEQISKLTLAANAWIEPMR